MPPKNDSYKEISLTSFIEYSVRIDILEERFERHLTQQDVKVEKLSEKIDEVLEKINKSERELYGEITSTKIKIAGMSSLVGAMVTFILMWLKSKLGAGD